MTVWGLNNNYTQSLYPQYCGFESHTFLPSFSSIPASIFSFGSPRYDVFNNNVFGYTPATNFSYLPQLDNPFNYMGSLNFTPQFTMPLFSNSNLMPTLRTSPSNLFGFLSATNPYTKTTSNLTNISNASRHRSSLSFNTNTTLPTLKSVGYNANKAQKLANAASKESIGRFDGQCAKHVKTAIQNAGLGAYQSGHAYQMDTILSKNSNFKQISAEGIDLKKLPAGCVLVYEKGVSRYSSEYGHVEITLGDGTAVSGGRTRNLRAGAKIFVPV